MIYPATHTVHMPSGPVNACAPHATRLDVLAAFMGFHAAITEAPEGATCSNCENEAKAQPKR